MPVDDTSSDTSAGRFDRVDGNVPGKLLPLNPRIRSAERAERVSGTVPLRPVLERSSAVSLVRVLTAVGNPPENKLPAIPRLLLAHSHQFTG